MQKQEAIGNKALGTVPGGHWQQCFFPSSEAGLMEETGAADLREGEEPCDLLQPEVRCEQSEGPARWKALDLQSVTSSPGES